jgi:hypothetical protein
MPDMNYSMIMTATRGMCDEMSLLAIFSMRALGIPVTKDYTLKWPGNDVGHTWNSVYVGHGKHFSFMGAEKNPVHEPVYGNKSKSKVLRQTFAEQNINTDDSNIPDPFRDKCMKDVTEEYLYGSKVKIPVKYQPSNDTKYVWLASRNTNNWNIIGWGETDSRTIDFGAAGKNIIYLPLYYENNVQTPAHYPFIVYDNDSIRIFEPDTGNYQQITITEISYTNHRLIKRMEQGVFEGANRSDFSDAKMLHTVKKIDGAYFYTAKISNSKQYRYVRYVSPQNSYGNVAEIAFYNAEGEKLSGAPFNSLWNPHTDTSKICERVFDGDIFTFYDSEKNGSWVGLDLGKPQTIAEIRYFPRHDDNYIYEGHTYNLFFLKDKEWQLHEQQVATSHSLTFRIPVNGLFYLRNVTTNKTGPWFTLNKNGERLLI